MGSIKLLRNTLDSLCDSDHYLFTVSDFYSIFPTLSKNAFKTLLSRAQAEGILKRIISQIPINRITLMSSGRSSIINCGTFGSIEFIHTKKSLGV